MCVYLGIARSTLQYRAKEKTADSRLENEVLRIFSESNKNYGQRKIQAELKKNGYAVSPKRVKKIMKKHGLVSKYNLYRKANPDRGTNEGIAENRLARNFGERAPFEAVVSDLTYVSVCGKWMYICLIIELSKREIIGYAAGETKDAALVEKALLSVPYDLRRVSIFHSDRGKEFDNECIEKLLNTFQIERSLSRKGSPVDNAVAESMYDILKVEFVFGEEFSNLLDLQHKLDAWVDWYNNRRLHGSLGYLSPAEAKEKGIHVPKGKRYEFDKVTKKYRLKVAA